MSKFAVTYRGTVYPWQCDHMGHMNVMWYTGKFDEASWHILAALGLTRARLRRESAGMAAVEQQVEYKRELRAGDIVTVRSTVLEAKDKTIRLRHEMRNDETGELAAATVVVGVYIDATVRKARHLPFDVRERAELMISCRDLEQTSFETSLELKRGSPETSKPAAEAESDSPVHPIEMALGSCW